jgi:DNA replication protein DnaC
MKKTKSGLPILNQTQLAKALDIAKENNKGLIVLGLPGIGKTYTMKNWLKETYPGNLQLIDYNSDEIVSNYSIYGEKIFRDAELPGNKLAYLNRLPIFIDDLGTEKNANHYGNVYNVIENIILQVYRSKQTFYATTNLNFDELAQRYGERIIDRFKEMCIIVVMEGPNYRNTKQEENQKYVEMLYEI